MRPALHTARANTSGATGSAVTLVSLLVLLAVISAIAQTIQLQRIRRERDRADRITDFLTDMFKVPAPSEARGNTVTAREILDRSSNEIERELHHDPEVRSQLMLVMAKTYENLGLFSRAHDLMERVVQDRRKTLGPDHPKTLEAMSQMGWVLYREGREVGGRAPDADDDRRSESCPRPG